MKNFATLLALTAALGANTAPLAVMDKKDYSFFGATTHRKPAKSKSLTSPNRQSQRTRRKRARQVGFK